MALLYVISIVGLWKHIWRHSQKLLHLFQFYDKSKGCIIVTIDLCSVLYVTAAWCHLMYLRNDEVPLSGGRWLFLTAADTLTAKCHLKLSIPQHCLDPLWWRCYTEKREKKTVKSADLRVAAARAWGLRSRYCRPPVAELWVKEWRKREMRRQVNVHYVCEQLHGTRRDQWGVFRC